MGAKFYQDTLNLKTNQYVTINFKADSLTASGVNNDSIIYKKVTNLSEIKLPVDKLKTQSRFSIKFNEVYDTITVLYQIQTNTFRSNAVVFVHIPLIQY